MKVEVRDLTLALGERKRDRRAVLREVSFSVPDGAFVSLLGESGAGKSTVLKVIAGILLQDSGAVLFDGRCVDGLPPHRRDLGFVFQDVRLFPHMTVAENVAYPLRMRGVGRRERTARAAELLERVQLPGFGPREPRTLSGGQAQRVALARALAARPAALLMDEPFSGLDESLRDDMRSLVLRLQREEGCTTLMVTHDASEALMMSERVVALDGGAVAQAAPPEELFARPATAKIAACFGDCSVLEGQVRQGIFHLAEVRLPAPGVPDGAARAVVRHGRCAAAEDARRAVAGGAAAVGIGSVDAAGECQAGPGAIPPALAGEGAPLGADALVAAGKAMVRCNVYAGATYLARLDCAGQTLTVPVPAPLTPGETVPVAVAPDGCFVFPA